MNLIKFFQLYKIFDSSNLKSESESDRRKVDIMEQIDDNHERKKFKQSISIVDLVIYLTILFLKRNFLDIFRVLSVTSTAKC
jgi:hypothetical protein